MCSIDLAESLWTQVSKLESQPSKCHCSATNPLTRTNQDLPQLPVPDLWLTMDRYLSSLRAVLKPVEPTLQLKGVKLSAEKQAANSRQFEQTERLAKQFLLDAGPQLQRDLKEYANKCQNWVSLLL